MINKLTESDLLYLSAIPKKVADFITGLALWENDACQLAISPATLNMSVSDCNAGAIVPVTLSIMSTEATPTPITFVEFTLGASVADTVADASLVPTIDDATPTMLNGEVTVNVTIPEVVGEDTYVADEAITLTIANYTAKDGRTVTGGTCVITVVADA